MEKPNSLASLKRFMSIGQKWDCSMLIESAVIWTPGIRELAYIDTVKFGFRTDKGTISYCDWPKAKELVFINNPDKEEVKFKITNPHGPRVLVYTLAQC